MIINKRYLWWCCKYEWAKISRIRRCEGAAMAQTHTRSRPAAGDPRVTSAPLFYHLRAIFCHTDLISRLIFVVRIYFPLRFLSVSLKEQTRVYYAVRSRHTHTAWSGNSHISNTILSVSDHLTHLYCTLVPFNGLIFHTHHTLGLLSAPLLTSTVTLSFSRG